MTDAKPGLARTTRTSGFTTIVIATAIAGVAAYAVTLLVPNAIGLADYAVFAIFWSTIYLVVGALFGIQQEIARGTHPLPAAAVPHSNKARSFALSAAVMVFVVVVGSAPLWVTAIFPAEGWSLVWPLAVGTSSYVLVAVLCGSLYGVSAWRPLAMMMIADAVLRLAAIGAVLLFTTNVTALAWAVAAPFPLTMIALWPYVRSFVVGKSTLDVPFGTLFWNVARTIVAAASTGLMVSGFALLLGLTSPAEPRALIGTYILAITLTRAPLIVVAMSLQSYFVVTFRNSEQRFWRIFFGVQAVIVASGVVLAAAGWLIGPAVFHFLFPRVAVEGWFIAALVGSSALVAALCISAAAVLSRSRHFVYSAGWVIAAVVTLGVLLLPIEFTLRTVLTLLCAPLAGLAVHCAYLVGSARGSRTVGHSA
ncbi:hypothetical protein [Lacisediminihabitans profunda]|uniref:Polysaccharide biosynthesis protein n=1 Tax=Lacisediminihabitans profunda TaxID=2594790 RepID=A0A5C8UJ26_9MICO|nr:hypothetical protein [Lacisediminihabitans profunda]TXN28231.1 hypothetical protein FVP33_17285 [Lacisediminihabitans profunda]